jgi:hypothetical protein
VLRFLTSFLPALLCLVALACPSLARADVLQMPIGADFITLPHDSELCGPAPEGFVVDASRKRIRPRNDLKAGYEVTAQIAPHEGSCEASVPVTLIVTGAIPVFDPTSVTVAIDAGRIEVSGKYLQGALIGYAADGKTGSDVCLETTRDQEERESCAVGIPQDLPADPQRLAVLWAPAGGRIANDMHVFDARGVPVPPERLRLPVARILLQRMFPASRTVSLSTTDARLPLEHSEAVSSAECGGARCEVQDGRVIVGSVPANAQSLSVRIRLLPRVFISRGDAVESTVSETLTVLRCPLDVISGPPVRGVDDLQILVRLSGTCGANIDQVRFTVSSDPVEATRVEATPDGVYALLSVGRVSRDRVNIVAMRSDNGSVLAVTSASSIEIPPPHTSLSLEGLGEIDFIPKNRAAAVTVSHLEGYGKLVPISVPGVYTVQVRDGGYTIRGVAASSGYGSLRFAYRTSEVPQAFAEVDFAHISDPVQRPIREANVPAPIGGSSVTDKPVIELHCLNGDGKLVALAPGTSEHIPFEQRDSCRLSFHKSRIPQDAGEQRLELVVTVTNLGGSERGEAHVGQTLHLRHGPDTDVIWIRGAKEQFDRIDIRVNQVVDETLFLAGNRRTIALTSAQWSVVTEDADFRFYATAAIPGSLYRFSDDPGDLGTGPLSLNFGVLSRLTWLDSDGHEGLVGLEAGMMGMGLATDRERQLALVFGVGIAIPIGNPNQPTQAAINIHAWMAYTVGDRSAPLLDDQGQFDRDVKLNPWAFVFGPSITVGSIGVFL